MMNELKKKRVLVTSTSFGSSDPDLIRDLENAVGEVVYNDYARPLSESELIPLIGEIDGFIAGVDDIGAEVIRAGRKLKVIARYGTGTDRVDIQAATRKGIVVTNTPGANSAAVAELTVGLMIALARNLYAVIQATRSGGWPRYTGVGFKGKTVGLVGLGFIGREVAKRLKPFGCRLLGTDPVVDPQTARSLDIELVDLFTLLSRSHFVSLHLPVTPETLGMINRETLGRMQHGAFLINTARGELVDESALKEALESGRLGGAATDVFSKEPPGKDHPLLRISNFISTPHMASRTDDAVNQMGRMAMQDCLSVLEGKRPQHVVNPEVFS
jgi:D-3-phosphoglycerate dehydrogenase